MLLPGETLHRDRLKQAVALVEGDVPPSFGEALFDWTAPEDFAALAPNAIARLIAEAWQHLKSRRPGTHHVRVYNPELPAGAPEITVVEIINDDMPFLLDSVTGALGARGIDPRLVVHPILAVDRDASGALTAFKGDANREEAEGTARESLIHIHIDPIDAEDERSALADELDRTLIDVRVATSDWQAMTATIAATIADFRETPPPLPADEVAEAIAFLQWLVDDNFTFLGVREYTYAADAEGGHLAPRDETGLGILRDPELRLLRRGRELVAMTQEIRDFLHEPVPLIVTKASLRARVHRRSHLDYIGVKLYDDDGKLQGELRLVGLFTSTAYTVSARKIPLLRRKIDLVARKAGLDHESHSGKALMNVLESYPRDELFQIDPDLLYDFAFEVLSLYERPRVKALARLDKFDRFVSVMVYIPRDRYDSNVRSRVAHYLASIYEGRLSAYYPSFPEPALARVHYIIGRDEGETPKIDYATLQSGVAREVQTWSDRLRANLGAQHEGVQARALGLKYANAFSPAYQDLYGADVAVTDIATIQRLSADRPIAIDFLELPGESRERVHLRILSRGEALPLSTRVPMLENMGFRAVDERTDHIEPAGEEATFWLHDMTLERASGGEIKLDDQGERLEALFMAVIRGQAENDGYNALTLEARMGWRDIAMLRALSRYLRQVPVRYSQDYMWSVLIRHSAIVEKIIALFHLRFDPAVTDASVRAEEEKAILAQLETDLGMVASLDEDRILRRFINLVQSTLRTTFFQLEKDGRPHPVIAFKLDSHKVEGLPAPRPLYEIFAYSPRVEGVHLRFGKVARGGLRWSDRPQDFRTEVLGLVKAQQVKNAVIVPVGAKGGFVPKQLPAGPREAIFAEGTEAYKIFVSALLDLTDDIEGTEITHPELTVRHDGDDPYMVVAADKGTATFSDTANAISEDRDFWLGDAFASGGSAGYDHKGMGITARGAWEAVKRHFREMDRDIQSTPFTAVGVGDMSGDVFGNGMLLSQQTRLIAAFDHRDIFIDPNPDPATSFTERKRLFDLPRSSWQDYNPALISQGGGVFSRTAKSITLSAEAQAAIGLAKETATPQEVMNAILKAPVDLLWFGGIGTYIRASTETDDQVGDRANDPIRIAGSDVRAKVVGEGANLGVTQRGRIEAARKGIRINTDAIDNSAGVNTSDVEVNIKVALTTPMKDGRLPLEERNRLLADMTEEVSQLVLRNNYYQTLALSLTERRGLEDLSFERRLMQTLEGRKLLDRAVEFLPDDNTLAERAQNGQGLTRPELAVLIAYAKISLYDDLLLSSVPDDRYLGRELFRYFPTPMQQRFPDAIEGHRLRREIIATMLANSMINRCGPSLLARVADKTGADVAEIAGAFAATRDSYGLADINAAIDALDARISGDLQLQLYTEVQDLLLSRIVWFLRHVDFSGGLEAVVTRFRTGLEEVRENLNVALGKEAEDDRLSRIGTLEEAGVPRDLAQRIASLPALYAGPDIVLIAERTGKPIAEASATLFAVDAYFGMEELRASALTIQVPDYYERLAFDRALDMIANAQRGIAAEAINHGAGAAAVHTWSENRPEAPRVRQMVQEICSSGLTVAKLSVVASLLSDLVKG
ncbi:NAD-glutamate dehydrogenase [Agaricicola taiwanensis]|uniref:NAD-glutamate dehydrogenase n=1 Tax=Agaricicola taiwanensis TaxID=591372 RepID=A0A8J2YEU7_9RHOB|nr:NAD-glutamate dehydrogenase [Agaricicola taiwanensis]GGE27513.1 NAD-glutamate dehydrogenase [Agaricicola taiwanensis]